MKDPKDFYLTTAITYTSGKPHIGNTGTLTVAEPLILKNVLNTHNLQVTI